MVATSKKKGTVKKAPASKKAGKAASTSGTRTSSRSAKRRSPKEPEEDPEVLEFERLEFLRAMDRYKRQTGKTFPSWTEVLVVLRSIGWMHPSRVQDAMEKGIESALTKAAKATKRS